MPELHIDNQAKIQSAFKAAFRKMTILGHSESSLIECSEVIQTPPALKGNAHLPAGQTMNDIEQAVRFLSFVNVRMLTVVVPSALLLHSPRSAPIPAPPPLLRLCKRSHLCSFFCF